MGEEKTIEGTFILIGFLVVAAIGLGVFFLFGTSVCNEPYFEYQKDVCCLDQNADRVCDKDGEVVREISSGGFSSTGHTKEDVLEPRKERIACPFECCAADGDYEAKLCQNDYSCRSNSCVPDDSDQDGLYDFEEKQLGTNLRSEDTDGDFLTDYQEVKVTKSDPLNRNTDGDRYIDGEDDNPLAVNSALVQLSYNVEPNPSDSLAVVVSSTLVNVATGASSSGAAGAVVGTVVPGAGNVLGGSGGAVIGAAGGLIKSLGDIRQYWQDRDKVVIKFTLTNSGNDYTEYAEFDLVTNAYYRKGDQIFNKKRIKIATLRSERLIPGQSREFAEILDESELKSFLETKLTEPSQCDGLFEFCHVDGDLDLSDVRYESYP